ncbi:hypothetical protein BGZ98_004117 [Dissophora globulifera]|nr:hypothetical protein BGZ98_004117 [Dissophora globulifera]
MRSKPPQKGMGPRWIDCHFDFILDWLEDEDLRTNIFGSDEHVPIGTSLQHWREFAKAFNEAFPQFNLNGKTMRDRFRRKHYDDVRTEGSRTGFGLEEVDRAKGIRTISAKLHSLCYGFDRMDRFFRDNTTTKPLFHVTTLERFRSQQPARTASHDNDQDDYAGVLRSIGEDEEVEIAEEMDEEEVDEEDVYEEEVDEEEVDEEEWDEEEVDEEEVDEEEVDEEEVYEEEVEEVEEEDVEEVKVEEVKVEEMEEGEEGEEGELESDRVLRLQQARREKAVDRGTKRAVEPNMDSPYKRKSVPSPSLRQLSSDCTPSMRQPPEVSPERTSSTSTSKEISVAKKSEIARLDVAAAALMVFGQLLEKGYSVEDALACVRTFTSQI